MLIGAVMCRERIKDPMHLAPRWVGHGVPL
jgi:hypothetical protein